MKKYVAFASTLLLGAAAAFGTTITPGYDTFGPLSVATFGGSGIPNNAVAQTTDSNPTGGSSITLGLTATGRYSNPTVGNNGAGVFYATPGENDGLTSPGHTLGPTWNFDYYVNITGPAQIPLYHVGLLYGNNTTGASQFLDFGTLGAGTYQDSWNLDMSFLSGIGFDPNADGVYGFELEILNSDNHVVDSAAINVDVATVPDTASTAMLLGLAFAGLAMLRVRQVRLATVTK